jgi:hypothetical protein
VAEEDVRSIQVAYGKATDASVRDRLAIAPLYGALLEAADTRLGTLWGPCLAAEVCVTHALPVPTGTFTVVAQTLSGASLTAARISNALLWQPPDPEEQPALLMGASEASHVARSFEPPGAAACPLPVLKAPALPLRCRREHGTLLGVGTGFGGAVDARLSQDERLRHVYVVGQTGTGKSTLLLNMALDDIDAGHGVTVLDPHGSLVDDLLARIPSFRLDDVILIDPGTGVSYVPLNPLVIHGASPEEYVRARDHAIDDLLDVFDAVYDLRATGGPIFEQAFRAITAVLIGSRTHDDFRPSLPMLGALMLRRPLLNALETRLLPIDAATRLMLEQLRLTKGEAALENLASYVAAKVNRFYAPLAARRTLCQGDCLDAAEVIARRRIVLAKLPWPYLGREGAALIARLFIGRLTREAMARGPGRGPMHFIYADEFHQFATERFAMLLAEARKFRVGLVLAHQYTSQLTKRGDTQILEAILGNVGTLIAFRLGLKDADLLEPAFTPTARAGDIATLPNYRAIARLSSGLDVGAFTLDTRPPREADAALRGLLPSFGQAAADADADVARHLSAFEQIAERQ